MWTARIPFSRNLARRARPRFASRMNIKPAPIAAPPINDAAQLPIPDRIKPPYWIASLELASEGGGCARVGFSSCRDAAFSHHGRLPCWAERLLKNSRHVQDQLLRVRLPHDLNAQRQPLWRCAHGDDNTGIAEQIEPLGVAHGVHVGDLLSVHNPLAFAVTECRD